jgi:hypothetical protein
MLRLLYSPWRSVHFYTSFLKWNMWDYIIYLIEFWSFNWLFMVTWYSIENSIFQECNGIRSIALSASAIVLYVLFHCTLCVFDKSHPSKYFLYESISVFWYYIKQIMNVYSCNGKNIFIISTVLKRCIDNRPFPFWVKFWSRQVWIKISLKRASQS